MCAILGQLLSILSSLLAHSRPVGCNTRKPGRLGGLTYLGLNDNQLTVLPPTIGNLANLTSLILHNNRLTSLPVEIGNLTCLEYLRIYANELTGLPSEIVNLANLEKLDISGNLITVVPPKIKAMIGRSGRVNVVENTVRD